ncbi:MAG: lipoyl(octanoyl) transferase LipB [Synechococcales cyanobacterium]
MSLCELCQMPETPYSVAHHWQKQRLASSLAHPELPDGLLLLTHPPVYTLGQGGDPRFLKFDPAHSAIEVHRVERGGEVTYHGPGQWVAYPILNLRRHRCDLHWYLRQLEAVVIATVGEWGLRGERVPGLTGVWIEGYKVAAIGIRATRWWTYHGVAVNVCPAMEAFSHIVPCGIGDRPVGSLSQFCPQVTMAEVAEVLLTQFQRQFDWQMQPLTIAAWLRE